MATLAAESNISNEKNKQVDSAVRLCIWKNASSGIAAETSIMIAFNPPPPPPGEHEDLVKQTINCTLPNSEGLNFQDNFN
jgi:hypothetical protein